MFGHEMIDDFIDLYNSKNSIFANDQKDVLAKLTSGKSQLAENKKYTEPGGYILNLLLIRELMMKLKFRHV